MGALGFLSQIAKTSLWRLPLLSCITDKVKSKQTCPALVNEVNIKQHSPLDSWKGSVMDVSFHGACKLCTQHFDSVATTELWMQALKKARETHTFLKQRLHSISTSATSISSSHFLSPFPHLKNDAGRTDPLPSSAHSSPSCPFLVSLPIFHLLVHLSTFFTASFLNN